MPLFFFDVQEDDVFTEDGEGTELRGRELVFAEARRLVLAIATDVIPQQRSLRIEISVREATGGPIHWHILLVDGRWADGLRA